MGLSAPGHPKTQTRRLSVRLVSCIFSVAYLLKTETKKKELICFLFFSKNKSENKQKAKNCQLSNKTDSKYAFGCSLFFTEINVEKKLNEN